MSRIAREIPELAGKLSAPRVTYVKSLKKTYITFESQVLVEEKQFLRLERILRDAFPGRPLAVRVTSPVPAGKLPGGCGGVPLRADGLPETELSGDCRVAAEHRLELPGKPGDPDLSGRVFPGLYGKIQYRQPAGHRHPGNFRRPGDRGNHRGRGSGGPAGASPSGAGPVPAGDDPGGAGGALRHGL